MVILNRYIRNQVVAAILVVIGIFACIDLLMGFVSQLDSLGKGDYGIGQIVVFAFLELPANVYQLFPMAGFLGSLMGLGRLMGTSELLVMRASGISVAQIIGMVLRAAFWMVLLMTMVGEAVAPNLQSKAENMRALAMSTNGDDVKKKAVWLRNGPDFMRVDESGSAKEVADVTVFHFNPDRELVYAVYAPKAVKKRSGWTLLDSKSSIFSEGSMTLKQSSEWPMSIIFNPLLSEDKGATVNQLSAKGIYEMVNYRNKAGLDSQFYAFTFFQRLIQPLTTMLMICLGVPFVFGALRNAASGYRVFIGVIVGFSFYILNQCLGPLAMVYRISPWTAAVLPLMIFMGVYVILMRRST